MADRNSITVESWRPVVGFEGFYSISDLGRLRRDQGKWRGMKTPTLDNTGYYRTALYRHGHAKYRCIHQLVAEAFIGPKPDGYVVNHIDADRTNNVPCNLEYVTPAENNRHCARLGRTAKGEKHGTHVHPESVARGERHGTHTCPESYALGELHHNATLLDAEALAISDLHERGVSSKDLAKQFMTSPNTLRRIFSRKGRFARIGLQGHGNHNWLMQHPEARARGERHGSRTCPNALPRGEAHYKAKISNQNAQDIVSLLRTGMPAARIAKIYHVSDSSVLSIKHRRGRFSPLKEDND